MRMRLSVKQRSDTRLSRPRKYLCVFVLLSSCPVFSVTAPDSITPVTASSQKLKMVSQINECEKNNRPFEADSLYGVLDKYGLLNTEQLLKWARWQELLKRYAGSIGLYCRLLDADRHFGDAVYDRMYQLFADAPQDSAARALGAFEKCMLGRNGIDTLEVRLRLASFYASHGLDSAELNVLAAASGPPARLVPRFMDMARERFAERKYAAAIPPAALAYERAGGRAKISAADLLFTAYRALHRYDSALVWIGRSDLSNESRKTEAAALYQRVGRLPEAGDLIVTLPRSFNRDTLELRQLLFNGDTRSARELARKTRMARPQYPDETLVWSARTLLFDGAFDDLAALLDTAQPSVSWSGATEVLDCRLMLSRLRGSREALTAWSHADYDIFAGKSGRAISRVEGQQVVHNDFRTDILVRVIKGLLAQGDTAAVMALFMKQGSSIDSPEYLYRYAEFMLRTAGPEQVEQTRQTQKAEAVLLRIMKDYPGGVFSEKSRILLSKIKAKSQ